jgi:hypothetical protein
LRGSPRAVKPFQNNETSQYSRFHRAPIVMRTACLVTVISLLSIALPGFAQDDTKAASARAGSLDQEITVTGGDETSLPVPPPASPAQLQFPEIDLQKPPSPMRALVQPPSGVWAAPPAEWRVKDVLGEGMTGHQGKLHAG